MTDEKITYETKEDFEQPTLEEIYSFLEDIGSKEEIKKIVESYDGKPTLDELAELKRISKNALVVQSNELAEASQSLSSVELRIVYNLIGLLNPQKEEDFIATKVLIKDLALICDFDPKSAYSQINKACDSIMRKPIIIKTHDRNGKDITLRRTWFTNLDTFEGEGYILFKFHPDLKDELLQFHKYGRGYVSTKGNIINELADVYSMRFFQLMVKNIKTKTCEYTIDEIIDMFCLQGKYIDKRTNSINTALLLKRVVASAVEKINNITDLKIKYKPVKVGKKIESVRFFISLKNKEDINNYNNLDIPSPEESISWMTDLKVANKLKELKKYGFDNKYKSPALSKFTNADDFIAASNKAITAISEKGKRIKNPGGFMFSVIMNYNPSEERFFAEEEKQSRIKSEEKIRKINKEIENAKTWEQILDIIAENYNDNDDKEEIKNILREASEQRSDLYRQYADDYEKEYIEPYDIDIEIGRIHVYGIEQLKKRVRLSE